MTIEGLVVVLAYLAVLAVIVFPPERLRAFDDDVVPWWRNVRVWAAVIAVVQIAAYLRWA